MVNAHLLWMKNLLKGQMYTHIGLENMAIACMLLRSIMCQCVLSSYDIIHSCEYIMSIIVLPFLMYIVYFCLQVLLW